MSVSVNGYACIAYCYASLFISRWCWCGWYFYSWLFLFCHFSFSHFPRTTLLLSSKTVSHFLSQLCVYIRVAQKKYFLGFWMPIDFSLLRSWTHTSVENELFRWRMGYYAQLQMVMGMRCIKLTFFAFAMYNLIFRTPIG